MTARQLGPAGIPEDLEERAVERLGRQRVRVEAFVLRASSINWLTRAGQPEPWDAEVDRVWSLQEARLAERRFRAVTTEVWSVLENVGRAVGRFDMMQAAEEFWIARLEVPDQSSDAFDRLHPQLNSDMVGALREILLDDVVPIRLYRRRMEWYEKGHWLCAVDVDTGRLIVY